MSFETRLKLSFGSAKLEQLTAQATLMARAEPLRLVIGNRQPPITRASLQDDFERAVKHGMPPREAARLHEVLLSDYRVYEKVANDEAGYVGRFEVWKTLFSERVEELKQPAALEMIKQTVPEELKAKLTPQQLHAVAEEVCLYAQELLQFVLRAIDKALAERGSAASRTVGWAQYQVAVNVLRTLEQTALEPLKRLAL